MTEAQYIQHLPEKALDVLYESLSVQTMPEGRYDGRAWIYGHPVLGWLASLVWRGKVFDGLLVRNRIFGMLLIAGRVVKRLDLSRIRPVDPLPVSGIAAWTVDLAACQVLEIDIYYDRPWLVDYVRQVSPTVYLGRMQWRRWTVHFTLSQER